ncbi:MAG TPA: DUF5615 family PIN-like protein [Caulobacteraceae bacterium]|jgi:hypothetical protein
MRFLADENFPGAAVATLRGAQHDVAWVRELCPGADDADVLSMPREEQRVVLTFDKDFGELARASPLPRECGVVLFRTPMPPAGEAGLRVAQVILSRDDWAGHFSVVEPGRIRMRGLP